ncbi:beta-1,3-galactosyltransferase 4-like isoform X2 [Panulirus ornatus]|uniref:beta-1,3-galactosyltransferase 4-like isoform X2 n=1 Tax=Panulirus ornatus TaxID=150431 RepID=UPI003A87C950
MALLKRKATRFRSALRTMVLISPLPILALGVLVFHGGPASHLIQAATNRQPQNTARLQGDAFPSAEKRNLQEKETGKVEDAKNPQVEEQARGQPHTGDQHGEDVLPQQAMKEAAPIILQEAGEGHQRDVPPQLTTPYNPTSHPDRFKFIHSRKTVSLTGPRTNLIPSQVSWRHDLTHVCPAGGEPPFILALVVSAVGGSERRAFARDTWANPVWYPHSKIRAVFVLGATLDAALQEAVDAEVAIHNDVLQSNFIDSYSNLTYKTMSLLTWATSRCPDATFVAKVDDDVLVNPFHLRTFFEKQLEHPPKPQGVRPGDEVMEVPPGVNPATTYIYGRYDPVPYPLRYTKWAVSKEEYPEESFPPFVHGPAYVMGMAAARRLMQYAPYVPFLKLEDVYTTGLVAHAAGVKHVQINVVVNTFVADERLFNGTQAFFEETNKNSREKAWKGILKYAPSV